MPILDREVRTLSWSTTTTDPATFTVRVTDRPGAYAEQTYDHGGTAGDFSQAFDTRVTELTYDAQRRQTSRTLPLGVATPTDPDDFVERRFYSDRSLAAVVAADEPLTESVALGQLEYEISFEGVVTAYRYDNSPTGGGRLVAKYFYGGTTAVADYLADAADGSLTAAHEAVVYGYDAFGRQVQIIQDRDGNLLTTADQRVETTEYDTWSLISKVSTPEGVLNYEYDTVTGLRTRTWSGTNPAAPVSDTHYVYDTLGRLDQVEQHWRNGQQLTTPEVTDYVFDLIGNLDQVRLPGGVVSDYQYDELNRLTLLRQFRDENANGCYEAGVDALLAEFDYDLLPDGRRSGLSEKLYNPATQSLEETRIDWAYDGLGRLVRESHNSHHDDSLDFITDYVFDLVSNRLQKKTDTDPDWVALGEGLPTSPDETIGYTYDLNDRLLTETKDASGTANDRHTVYGYDATQQTAKTVYEGLDASGTKLEETTYGYNLQGRMSTVTIDSDGDGVPDTQYEYEYGASGIRVAQTKRVDGNGNGQFHDPEDTSDRTEYLVDHRNPTGYAQIFEEWLDGQLAKSYTLGLDVISQWAAAIAAGSPLFLLYDGHGSTRGLVDATGQPLSGEIYRYDAYGNPINFDPSTAATSLLYAGEKTDPTGLQYLRARYYNPATGTFNRLDPFFGNLQDPLSLHKYLYTHGDPVNAVDPTGLWSMGQVIATVGITSAFTAYTMRAYNETGKSLGQGLLTGIVGGGAIAKAIFSGNWWALVEAGLSAGLAVTVSMLYDYIKQGGLNRHWEYQATAAEAFAWSAFGALWGNVPKDYLNYPLFLRPDGFAGTIPMSERIFAIGAIEGLQMSTQLGAIVFGGLMDVVSHVGKAVTVGVTPNDESALRSRLEDTVSGMIAWLPGAFVSFAVSGATDWFEQNVGKLKIMNLFGFRYLPARMKGEIVSKGLEIAGYGVNEWIDDISGDIANTIADALTDILRFGR